MSSLRPTLVLAWILIMWLLYSAIGASVAMVDARIPLASLQLSASELRVCDPILVKVTLINYGKDRISFRSPNAIPTKWHVLELRQAGSDGITRHHELSSLCGECFPPMLIPGESLVELDSFAYPYVLPLSAAGQYEIRAAFLLADGRSLFSPWKKLRLTPIADDEKKLIEANLIATDVHGFLRSLVKQPISVPTVADAARLMEVERKLTASGLRTTLRVNLAVAKLAQAGSPRDEYRAWEELNKLRKGLDHVTNEIVTRELARLYLQKKSWKKAGEIIETFQDKSFESDWFRQTLQNRQLE